MCPTAWPGLACRSSGDALSAAMDEVSRLQAALRRKQADVDAVETEVAAQISDYTKLKQRLLQQVRAPRRGHACMHVSTLCVWKVLQPALIACTALPG